jgi:Sortase domain
VDRRAVVLLAVLATALLAVAFVRANGDPAPVTVAPAVEVARELPPPRQYPAVDPADLAPGRPPFVQLKGFPPPPPAVRVSSGPVRRFAMPRLEIDNALEVLSMGPTGQLPTPADANYRVGWYTDFGLPGTGGNAVLTAHETWNHLQAPFFNLHRAVPGDEIVVDMADGRRLVYAVTSNIRYDVHSIPMAEIIWPSTRGNSEWITLITCGGRIVYDEVTGFGEYLDRDVVVARLVS